MINLDKNYCPKIKDKHILNRYKFYSIKITDQGTGSRSKKNNRAIWDTRAGARKTYTSKNNNLDSTNY